MVVLSYVYPRVKADSLVRKINKGLGRKYQGLKDLFSSYAIWIKEHSFIQGTLQENMKTYVMPLLRYSNSDINMFVYTGTCFRSIELANVKRLMIE